MKKGDKLEHQNLGTVVFVREAGPEKSVVSLVPSGVETTVTNELLKPTKEGP